MIRANLVGVIDSDISVVEISEKARLLVFDVKTRQGWVRDKDKPNEWWRVELMTSAKSSIQDFIKKGKPMSFYGYMRQDSWEKKDGSGKAYRTVFKAEGFEFVYTPKNGNEAPPVDLPAPSEQSIPSEPNTVEQSSPAQPNNSNLPW